MDPGMQLHSSSGQKRKRAHIQTLPTGTTQSLLVGP